MDSKLAAALAERQLSRLPNVTFAGFVPVEELKQLSYSREMDQIATSAHRISCPAAVNRKWPDWYSYLRFSLCCNAITLSSSDVQKCLVYALPKHLLQTCETDGNNVVMSFCQFVAYGREKLQVTQNLI